MAQLLALRAFIAVLKRSIALSDKLKPTTWKYLAVAFTILTILSFWGYRNIRQHHVLITDQSSSSSSYESHEGQITHTPVVAAASGEFIIARDMSGHVAYIDHGNGFSTRYMHLSRIAVSDGQRIMRGKVLGYIDSTGSSTGSHLHFALRNINPAITGYSWNTESPANQPFGGTIEGKGFVSGTQVCINTNCDPAPGVASKYSGHDLILLGGDLHGWHQRAFSDDFGSITRTDTPRNLVLEPAYQTVIPVTGRAEAMAAASYAPVISPGSLMLLESNFLLLSKAPADVETVAQSDATSLITEVSRLCAAVIESPRTTEAGPTVVMVVMPPLTESKPTPTNLPLWAVFAAFIFNGVSAVIAWISTLISHHRGKTDQMLKTAQIAKLQIEIVQLHKQLEREARETSLNSAMPWF